MDFLVQDASHLMSNRGFGHLEKKKVGELFLVLKIEAPLDESEEVVVFVVVWNS